MSSIFCYDLFRKRVLPKLYRGLGYILINIKLLEVIDTLFFFT